MAKFLDSSASSRGKPYSSGPLKLTFVQFRGSLFRSRCPISFHRASVIVVLVSMLISSYFSIGKGVSEGFYLEAPFVRQVRNFCGPACLAMVLRYWGLETNQHELADHFQPFPRKGLSGSQLKGLAQEYGFSAFSFSGRPEEIRKHLREGRPLIVALGPSHLATSNHYVVLVGWDDSASEWVLHDPTEGPYRRLSEDKLSKKRAEVEYWTLLLIPAETK